MLQWRNIQDHDQRTTICLEDATWSLIDKLAQDNWRSWVSHALISKPPHVAKRRLAAACCY